CWRTREQRRCLHDLSALAVAALRHIYCPPGALHRMVAVSAETFDGHHALVLQRAHLRLTRSDSLAVDVDRAGAAKSQSASKSRACKTQFVAQIPEQRHFLIAVEGTRCSVHIKILHGYDLAAAIIPQVWNAARI